MRVGAVLVLLSACILVGSPVASPAQPPWKQLRRPLRLPSLSIGEPCPVSDSRRRLGKTDALGEEAPYALPFPDSTANLDGTGFHGGRFAYRVRWLAPGPLAGPVLIRSRRLDRPRSVRFAKTRQSRTAGELRVVFTRRKAAQVRGSAFVLLPAPGCYGFQVDGLDFSNTSIFAARLAG